MGSSTGPLANPEIYKKYVFPWHKKYVEEAKERGFYSNTVGSIIAEKTGCKSNDPHKYLTHNLVDRSTLLVQAINIALGEYLEDQFNF